MTGLDVAAGVHTQVRGSVADAPLIERREKLLEIFKAKLGKKKPAAELKTMPWSEDRGPNPFLLATGQSGRPWEAGHFWEWFLSDPKARPVVERLGRTGARFLYAALGAGVTTFGLWAFRSECYLGQLR